MRLAYFSIALVLSVIGIHSFCYLLGCSKLQYANFNKFGIDQDQNTVLYVSDELLKIAKRALMISFIDFS